MVEFIPFTNIVSDDLNDLYLFTAKGKTKPKYKVSIEIDGLNDSLLVNQECECNNFMMNGRKSCKHILAAKDILITSGITWREPTQQPDVKKISPSLGEEEVPEDIASSSGGDGIDEPSQYSSVETILL